MVMLVNFTIALQLLLAYSTMTATTLHLEALFLSVAVKVFAQMDCVSAIRA